MRAEKERDAGCFAKALPHELTFTLLGRDASAPIAIRRWITHRVAIGKNVISDSEIQEAESVANLMEAEYPALRKELGKKNERPNSW
jgi:hypothetical protein